MFGLELLHFGNVTIVTLILLLTLGVLTLLIEAGIYLVKFCLALDDENAPEINIQNPLKSHVFCKYFLKDNIEVFENKFVIRGDTTINIHKFYYGEGETSWSELCKSRWYRYKTKEEAMGHPKYNPHSSLDSESITKVVITVLTIDLSLFMLTVSFLPTVIAGGLVSTIFAIRFLAKRLYKGMSEKQSQLDNHEERITKLEK